MDKNPGKSEDTRRGSSQIYLLFPHILGHSLPIGRGLIVHDNPHNSRLTINNLTILKTNINSLQRKLIESTISTKYHLCSVCKEITKYVKKWERNDPYLISSLKQILE
jgi:hypothetical protein